MNDAAIIHTVLADLRAEFGADLLGVLAGGSRLRGEGNQSSDLDLVVVTALPRRRRRNVVVGGVEVETFINPLFQMRRYFEEDRASGRGLMPHLCTTGQIVYDADGTIAALQAEAQAIWQAGPAALSANEQWQTRYALADWLRDIEDVATDPTRVAYLIGIVLPLTLQAHYRVQGRWQIKPKRVLLDLPTWDAPAAMLVQHTLTSAPLERRAALRRLIEHVLAPLGGPMPLAWHTEWEELES